MKNIVGEYYTQYEEGLITFDEFFDRIEKYKMKRDAKAREKRLEQHVYPVAQKNLDLVQTLVECEFCCHWGFFRENCPEPELDSFCNVERERNREEICEFIGKYI